MPEPTLLLDHPFPDPGPRPRVLVTGAAGMVGSAFVKRRHADYDLRLMVREGEDAGALEGKGEIVTGELADRDTLLRHCTGMHAVLHLAGDPRPTATWESLLPNNIAGTYHLLLAAKAAGVRRVVLASSIHAVSGGRADEQVRAEDPVSPGDLYGVSKCFVEAAGRFFATQEDLSVIAVRIGAFGPPASIREEQGLPLLDAWLSEDDGVDLLARSLDDRRLRFAIVQGVSNNRVKRLSVACARKLLGYDPQDDAAALNAVTADLDLANTLRTHNQTGTGNASGIRDDLAKLAERDPG